MNIVSDVPKVPDAWRQGNVPLSVFDLPLPKVQDDMLPRAPRYRDALSTAGLIALLILSMAAFGGSIWNANATYPDMVAFFERLG